VRAKPDGYTLSYIVIPTVVTHYLDPTRGAIYTRASFQPIARHYQAPEVLAVRADGPYHTIKDLVEAARAHLGAITVSDSGLMGVPNFETLMLGTRQEYGSRGSFRWRLRHRSPRCSVAMSTCWPAAPLMHWPYKKTGEFRVLASQPSSRLVDARRATIQSQGYDVIAVVGDRRGGAGGNAAECRLVLTNAMHTVIETPTTRRSCGRLR